MVKNFLFLHRIYRALLDWPFWVHLGVYALIWILLTNGDRKSWIIGIPAIILAGICNVSLTSPSVKYPRPVAFFFFVFYFLKQSFLSGIDVMRRTLGPKVLVDPGLVPFTTFLPEGSSRVLLANTISLLPGTLTVDIEDNSIIIHTIDTSMPTWTNIQKLEGHIATLFNIQPPEEK